MNKSKKSKFKKLLLVGLGNLSAGIVFGVGCIIAERVDDIWFQSEDTSSPK